MPQHRMPRLAVAVAAVAVAVAVAAAADADDEHEHEDVVITWTAPVSGADMEIIAPVVGDYLLRQ
jgi:ABC-type glycerol-3-phosphate transport system substrate-binding protein